MKDKLIEALNENPIIAAIHNKPSFVAAINSEIKVVFMLDVDIFTLKDEISALKEKNKLVFLHIDLLDGISTNPTGLRYVKEMFNPDGIISTKAKLIHTAKKLNLISVQRIFMLDSNNYKTGLKSLETSKPDAVEILPGIIPDVVKRFSSDSKVPIITGGFISEKRHIIENIKAGASGVSTGNSDLWNY